METISGNDDRLEPPDGLEYSECDECGEVFPTADLNHVKIGHTRTWLCEACLAKVAVPVGV
jgi:hypothetical protein